MSFFPHPGIFLVNAHTDPGKNQDCTEQGEGSVPGVGPVDAADGVGGRHQVPEGEREQANQNERDGRGVFAGLFFALWLLVVHALPDGRETEQEEDNEGQDVGVQHGVHRHRGAAQRARGEDVNQVDARAKQQGEEGVAIGVLAATHEQDHGAHAHDAGGESEQDEENPQPLEGGNAGEFSLPAGRIKGHAGRPSAAHQGEGGGQAHQNDAEEAKGFRPPGVSHKNTPFFFYHQGHKGAQV